MATYPYNPAVGGLVKAVEQFRRSFPQTVDSALLKRLGIAAANESYVINTLRFIGLIDDEGNRVEDAVAPFFGSDDDFKSGMEKAVRAAYKDLFSEYGEDAWGTDRGRLTTWFRQKDKTSELIGGRQAGTFIALAGFSGHGEDPKVGSPRDPANGAGSRSRPAAAAKRPAKPARKAAATNQPPIVSPPSRDTTGEFGLSVRIEVNLPANGTPETYDAIFASIRRNLIEREQS